MAFAQSVFFVDTNNHLWAMGQNSTGQLGLPASKQYVAKPAETLAEPVLQVSRGSTHTLVVKEDNTLWASGDNNASTVPAYSTLPAHANVDLFVWTQIMAQVKHAAAGVNNSMVVKEDGTLWGIGSNSYGQLGIGKDANTHPSSADVTQWTYLGLTDVKTCFAGYYNNYVIKNDGSIWAAGRDYNGLTGNGSAYTANTNTNVWRRITRDDTGAPLPTNIKHIECNSTNTAFLTEDGKLYAWGDPRNISVSTNLSQTPIYPKLIRSDVADFDMGTNHLIIKTTNNKVFTTGQNGQRQLGQGESATTGTVTAWGEVIAANDAVEGLIPIGPCKDVAAAQYGSFIVKDTMEVVRFGRHYVSDGSSGTSDEIYPVVQAPVVPTDYSQFIKQGVPQEYETNKPFMMTESFSVPPILQSLKVDELLVANTGIRYFFSTDNTSWKKYDTGSSSWIDATISATDVADVQAQGMTKAQVDALTKTELATFDGAIFYVAIVMWTADPLRSPAFRGIDAYADITVQNP
jgi:alpha-tubulin suppressor-like RCC1 family protein